MPRIITALIPIGLAALAAIVYFEWQILDGYKFATAVKDVATVVGIGIGGWWFIYRREHETALAIDVACTTHPYPGRDEAWLAFVAITLKNEGKVLLRAREKKPPPDSTNPDEFAYSRTEEGPEQRFRYGCSLKIRRLPDHVKNVPAHIDWFAIPPLEGWPAAHEFDAVSGYVKGEGGMQTDFWMEPGEKYSLRVPLVLAQGLYLALVTFIGTSDSEFWQQLSLLRVPEASPPNADDTT